MTRRSLTGLLFAGALLAAPGAPAQEMAAAPDPTVAALNSLATTAATLRRKIAAYEATIDNTSPISAIVQLHRMGDALRRLDGVFPPDTARLVRAVQPDPSVKALGKTPLPCPRVESASRLAVILIMGQSNATNENGGRHTAPDGVVNLSLMDGKCYRAADPLLGATGRDGNFATYLGDLLVRTSRFDRVLLVPVSVGGTYAHDWTPQGRLAYRLPTAVARLRALGLPVHFLLWHQGEADSGIRTPAPLYRERLMSVIEFARRLGVSAPVFVARASLCGGAPNQEIRQAQIDIVNGTDILAGADTDQMGEDQRMDGCHLGEAGKIRHAEMWRDILQDR